MPTNTTNHSLCFLGSVFLTLFVFQPRSVTSFPTDPLTVAEIELVGQLVSGYYVTIITPVEPPKAILKKFLDEARKTEDKTELARIAEARDAALPRRALAVVIDREIERAFEIVVDLAAGTIVSKTELPDEVQPLVPPGDFIITDQVLREDVEVQRRVAEQGLNMEDIVFDIWAPGDKCAGHPEFCGLRLTVAYPYFQEFPEDNSYAHPLHFYPIIDTLGKTVVGIDELPIYANFSNPRQGKLDLPHRSANYDPRLFPPEYFRKDIRPLTTTSEGGPSFKITDGYQVDWQGFRMRIGFNTREGVTLHDISYKERNLPRRSLIYRLSFSEMLVPYGDPRRPFYRKGAFDTGEYGLPYDANPQTAGVECPPQSYLIDVVVNDENGKAVTIPNAISVAETDGGILHRHSTDRVTVVRAQHLVIMFMITSTNYDYAFYYIFKQDGTIELKVGLTGILSTNLLMRGHVPFATKVADKVMAQYHQHLFCVRMDTSFDGEKNRISTLDAVPMPNDPLKNPFGNGFVAKETLLTTSLNSVTDSSLKTNRAWKIYNPKTVNPGTGNVGGYKLVTNNRPLALAHEDSLFVQRAGFIKHSTWVVGYREDELYCGGKYPNQNVNPTDGIAQWVKRNDNIVDKDSVVFHTFGLTHMPVQEEYPIMGMDETSISLKPCNFYKSYLGLDVPPPPGFSVRGTNSANISSTEPKSFLRRRRF